jgi:hypothetical protein
MERVVTRDWTSACRCRAYSRSSLHVCGQLTCAQAAFLCGGLLSPCSELFPSSPRPTCSFSAPARPPSSPTPPPPRPAPPRRRRSAGSKSTRATRRAGACATAIARSYWPCLGARPGSAVATPRTRRRGARARGEASPVRVLSRRRRRGHGYRQGGVPQPPRPLNAHASALQRDWRLDR